MGHTPLGRLPRTRKWERVVGLVGALAETPEIAAAALDGSKRGLEDAPRDPALVHSFWLLTQLPLCSRITDFIEKLAKPGVSAAVEPKLVLFRRANVLAVVGAGTARGRGSQTLIVTWRLRNRAAIVPSSRFSILAVALRRPDTTSVLAIW